MAIRIDNLRSAARRSRSYVATKSLEEAVNKKQKTAFLCHSHRDKDLARGLQNLLLEAGCEIYIDWQDADMPETPDKQTAEKIKNKIITTDFFFFLATPNSTGSRWCPWEIGYADSVKGSDNVLIFTTSDDDGWYGNEYLQLYKDVKHASNNFGKEGYAAFGPGENSGRFLNYL